MASSLAYWVLRTWELTLTTTTANDNTTMSSGFVSGGTTDAPIERDDEWVQAQQEIEATRRRKEEESRQTGGKTLFETLQANKGEHANPPARLKSNANTRARVVDISGVVFRS